MTSSKAPDLALPFGLVGFAAGWLSYGLLTIPVVDVIPRWAPLANRLFMVAPIAALVGAALGAALSRKLAVHEQRGARRAALLTALVTAGGIATWCLVIGPAMWEWAPVAVVVRGGLYALAFVPICALVTAAVRRTGRARHGSLVASVDRRTVWSILATVVAVSSVRGPSSSAALDGPLTFAQRVILLPRFGMVIASAAGLVVIVLFLTDTFARLRVIRVASAGFEECDVPKATHADAVSSFDIGLGEEVHARVDGASNTYREPPRPTGLLLGRMAAARTVLAWALLRDAICLAVIAAVLTGHCWAETPTALLAFLELRCQRSAKDCNDKVDWFGDCHRSRTACYKAGTLLLPTAAPGDCSPPPQFDRPLPHDVRRGEALFGAGSEAGDRCCCEALSRSYQSRGAEKGKPRLPERCQP